MVLLGLSNEFAYFHGREPVAVRDLPHDPWFWVMPERGEDAAAARERIVKAWQEKTRGAGALGGSDLHPLQKIKAIGPLKEVRSFVNHGTSRPAFPVYATKSFQVPEISDELFANHRVFTAEHDVPYQQRACVDLAAGTFETAAGQRPEPAWAFDTKGEKVTLKVLVYDIETTQFGSTGKRPPPIDMIGSSEIEISYRASKDLEKEEFNFEIVGEPPDWRTVDVRQEEAATPDAEVKILLDFVARVPRFDVISGHNILGFDNKEIYDRIQRWLANERQDRVLTQAERRAFQEFAGDEGQRSRGKWAAKDRTFTFGQQTETVNFHPTSFDTYHAARRFYFFLDDFTLKRVAPFMGIEVPNRVYLAPNDMRLGDERTRLYNRHDVLEQVGVTGKLLVQALPLAFSTGWTFEELLTGGNVRMWDHMGMIRAARARKIMPATCRAQGVARSILTNVGTAPTKAQIAEFARRVLKDPAQAAQHKELARVAKYGDEMPDFVEIPSVIVNPKAIASREGGENGEEPEEAEDEEYLGYSIPGGMTLHPQDLSSHFIPWWHVVTADVGAMYPTILRARNVSADTIRLARAGETPDAWVWMYRLPDDFTRDPRWVVRPPGPDEGYARQADGSYRGVMVGIKKNPEPGVTAQAMKGVMGIAARVKKLLGQARKEGTLSKAEIDDLAMMYASLKANRNAGTHGQMLAVNVSCRGFNLWAGGEITTVGQKILDDVMAILRARRARIVYGDSISGSRNVVVQDPKGAIRVVPISKLFETVGGQPHRWHDKEAVTGNGWKALSLEIGQGAQSPTWAPITRVIRHNAAKPMVRVRQPEGETVCTTDHSLMASQDGQIAPVRPEGLAGARMVRVPVPRGEVLQRIDLLPLLEPLARELEASLGPVRRRSGVTNERRFGYDDKAIWFGTRKNARGTLRRFIDPGTGEASAVCRLLGAYVSEGSVNWGPRQGASIANSDREWMDQVQRDYLTLFSGFEAGIIRSDTSGGREIRLKDGTVSVYEDRTLKMQVTNRLSALFFWGLAGRGSKGKRVPDFLYHMSSYDQGQFLSFAVEGDGSWVKDPRYTAAHRRRNFSYTTQSLDLASGMSVLLSQMGYGHSLRTDPKRGFHTIFTRETAKEKDRTSLTPEPMEPFVYDLEVEGTHTFVDAFGCILVHNTDGIYVGTSKSGRNFPEIAAALGFEYEPGAADSWYILPDDAETAIQEANDQIRKYLNYEAFELEAEHHDAMVFVVHKNYLIFDVKKGRLVMTTKGNNFRGSDKAPVAQKLLAEIMTRALRETIEWTDESKVRDALQASIKRATRDVIKTFDVSTVDRADLTLVQVVQPVGSYKPNPDGSPSIWMKRATALEKITGEKLRNSKKYRFVVCKNPLPGIEKPSKTGIKPLDYMWPVDFLAGRTEIDLAWYKDMIEKYVRGAFGFEDLELHVQKGLGAWM